MVRLPVESLRSEFLSSLEEGSVVVSAPTGSGKSTQVPRWCPGPVLVVEPRRVACRSLAQRVAELEECRLGEEVGYWVRNERRCHEGTGIVFATPGIVLRIFDRVDRYGTVILDEFHERSLETDLLLALLQERRCARLGVMSATLEGDRVAGHLKGRHLQAEGRTHPVKIEYRPGEELLPGTRNLAERIEAGVDEALDHDGDVLVFLPGKGEIAEAADRLGHRSDLEVMELHGGLSLERQDRVFRPAQRRKLILATNVAETSLTVPGVGVVVDSGLVRRTRYFQGRGYLALVPIAEDSADQRAGRAGRTAPGLCLRLWSPAARLEPVTPPAIHRESLTPLVLAAAACGARMDELPFLDPPPEHALEAARERLRALGAFDEHGRLTDRGGRLFGLPLDPALGRLLVEADARRQEDPELLPAMIDLVSVLATDRRLFRGGAPAPEVPDHGGPDPWLEWCDGMALLRALRDGRVDPVPGERGDSRTLAEARSNRNRLRSAFTPGSGVPELDADLRRRLALTAMAADPRRAYVARRRGPEVAWSNGGTEVEIGRETLLARRLADRRPPLPPDPEAVVALDTHALALGGTDTRVFLTRVMPVPLAWLREAGLGRDRLAGVAVEKRDGRPVRLVCELERVYAGKVLDGGPELPEGEPARKALAQAFLQGRVFPEAREVARDRLESAALAERLVSRSGHLRLRRWNPRDWEEVLERLHPGGVPDLEEWVASRIGELGVESGEDLALLEPEDLTPPELPARIRRELDREFPRELELPEGRYRVEYELGRRRVILHQREGRRLEAPSLAFLPDFTGFDIQVRFQGARQTIRRR